MNPRAKFWAERLVGFFVTIVGLCALGGLLGAIAFPLAGRLGGAKSPLHELIAAGAKTGGFFFMVWAPGVALVREFIRGAKAKRLALDHPPGTA